MRPNVETITAPYAYEQHDNNGNYYRTLMEYQVLDRTWSGVRTPEYKTRRLLRTLPVNPYSSNVVRISSSAVSFQVRDAPFYSDVSTLAIAFTTGTPPLGYTAQSMSTVAINKATQRLYEKIEGKSFNAALFLAERKQTADLIASTATRIYQAARAVKRADWRSFANSVSLSGSETRTVKQMFEKVYKTPVEKRLANHWLEFVFGWQPLLSDLHDAAELLAESLTTYEGPEGEVRASATFRMGYSTKIGGAGNRLVTNSSDLYAITAKIVAQYRLDSEARSILNKTGISNPASLAWEALPFSFVVDWFLPVGNYLDSLTAMDGFTITRGSISTLETAVSSRKLSVQNVSEQYRIENFSGGGGTDIEQVKYVRTPTTSFPYALRFRNPIPVGPLKRLTTATALLTQVFSSRNPRST